MRNTNVIKLDRAQYKIEKGVPLPSGRLGTKYPLATMEVGDSFVFPAPGEAALRQAIHRLQAREDSRFTCRRIGDDMMRVWRVS